MSFLSNPSSPSATTAATATTTASEPSQRVAPEQTATHPPASMLSRWLGEDADPEQAASISERLFSPLAAHHHHAHTHPNLFSPSCGEKARFDTEENAKDNDAIERDLDLAFTTSNHDSLVFRDGGGGLRALSGVPKQQQQHGRWCSCSQHCNEPALLYVGGCDGQRSLVDGVRKL